MAIATALVTPNGADSKRWRGAPEGSEWTPAELRDVVGNPPVSDRQTDTVSMSAMQYLVEVGRALQEYQGLSYAVQDRAQGAATTHDRHRPLRQPRLIRRRLLHLD